MRAKKKLSDPLTRELKRATNAIYTFLSVLVYQSILLLVRSQVGQIHVTV